MYNNPAIARGLLNIGDALMGDPVRQAQGQAAIAGARQRRAAAELDEQTADARTQVAESLLSGDSARAHAIASVMGNDYTRDFTSIVGAMMGLPGSDVSENDLSRYLVGGGVQKAQDTFTGMERDNAAALQRQRVSSGATVRAAQIRAEASERIAAQQRAADEAAQAAKLVEVMQNDDIVRVPAGEAVGLPAPRSVTEQQAILLKAAQGDLLTGEPVNPQLVDIVGGSAPRAGRAGGGPIGIEQLRLQIDTALEPFLENADPTLYAQAQAEIETLIAQGIPPAAAIADVVGRIAPEQIPGRLYGYSDGDYILAPRAAPTAPGAVADPLGIRQ